MSASMKDLFSRGVCLAVLTLSGTAWAQCADTDSDGVCDDVDNCPTVANGDQTDDNGDGYGDACVSPDATIAATAVVSPRAIIGASGEIGGYSRIGDGAVINGTVGDAVSLGSGSTVGLGATIGDATSLAPGASVGAGASLGDRVIVGADAVIGANAVLGDRVEVGARASIGAGAQMGALATVGADSVVADGVIIGSNAQLGARANLAAESQIEANSRIGDDFTAEDRAVVGPNCRIGDDVSLAHDATLSSYNTIGDGLIMGAGSSLASGATVGSQVTLGANVEVRGTLGNNVVLDDNAFTGNQSVVGDGARLHENASISLFSVVGPNTVLLNDATLYDGASVGANGAVGQAASILFRTTIGTGAVIGADVLIDEQITIGDNLNIGANSRLWPFSSLGDDVTIGSGVLIRDSATIGSGATFEDNVIVYPDSTINQGATIGADVVLGAASCQTRVCGHVTIGECAEITADVAPGAEIAGNCEIGLVLDGPARRWEDGTYAEDCEGYLSPEIEPYAYAGETGDGLYTIDPDGAGGVDPFDVACDMAGGGWIELTTTESQGVVMGQNASANPWRKCGGDSAQYYDWISEGAVSPDINSGSQTLNRALSYQNPTTGDIYSAAEVSALRSVLDELHQNTRMVATTSDDDNQRYQDNGNSGHEVYISNEAGQFMLLTPGEDGECGGGSGWPSGGSSSAYYLWHTTAAQSVVAGQSTVNSNALNGLPADYILPAQVRLAIYTGGGASFGWQSLIFRVR